MINLKTTFDDKFKNGLLDLIDYSAIDGIKATTEEEAIEKLKEDKEPSNEEKLAALMLVSSLFVEGTEVLNEEFQKELEEESLEYSSDEWIIPAFATAMAANGFYRQSVYNKFVETVDKFKDINSDIYLDIQLEVDKRIGGFLEEAILQGKKVTDSKMAFWASDQTGNLVRETTKGLFKENGVGYYIWRTMGDGRVRPSHDILNGTTRKWDYGIEPGEEAACRCYAEVPTQTQILKFKKLEKIKLN